LPQISRVNPKPKPAAKVTASLSPNGVTAPTQPDAGPDPWGATDSVRMLLYGPSGAGKTTLWATFPGPILCLLCSGGARPGELKSVATPENKRKIKPVIVTSVDHLMAEAEAAAGRYATLVLDHATGFSDLVIKELLGLDEIPVTKSRKAGKGESWSLVSQQQYGQVAVTCKETFRRLLNHPGHVVIVAQERVFGGREDGLPSDVIKPTVGAALTPSVTGWLNPACDYVVQMFKRPRMLRVEAEVAGQKIVTEMRDKGVDYCLRVEPHDVYMTKFRIPGGLPEGLDVIINPTYSKIVDLVNGGGRGSSPAP
jgi:hypothetical protein